MTDSIFDPPAGLNEDDYNRYKRLLEDMSMSREKREQISMRLEVIRRDLSDRLDAKLNGLISLIPKNRRLLELLLDSPHEDLLEACIFILEDNFLDDDLITDKLVERFLKNNQLNILEQVMLCLISRIKCKFTHKYMFLFRSLKESSESLTQTCNFIIKLIESDSDEDSLDKLYFEFAPKEGEEGERGTRGQTWGTRGQT